MTDETKDSMVTVAKLGANDVFLGLENVPQDQAGDRVRLPQQCDRPTDGSYYFDRVRGALHPVTHRNAHVPPPANNDELFFALFVALKKLGAELPAHIEQWLKWYQDGPLTRDEQRRRSKPAAH